MRKCIMLLLFIPLFITSALGQEKGYIKGKVTNMATGEEVALAFVLISQNNKQIEVTKTDFDGTYRFGPLSVGQYDITCRSIGYNDQEVKGILLKSNDTLEVNIDLKDTVPVKSVEIIAFQRPLFEPDQNTSEQTYTREDIENIPYRSVQSVSSGTYYPNERARQKSESRNIRGNRGTITYVDGVKLPNSKIESRQLIPGGVPAEHEDPNRKTPYLAPEQKKPSTADFNTEDYNPIVENEFRQPLHEPLSTFSIDVDKASYSNIRRYLNGGQMPPAGAVRIEEMINYFNYDYPQPQNEHPFYIHTEMSTCPWNQEHELVLIGLQGKHLPIENLPANNLVFLIDVSGSMSSYNKLPLVRESLKLLVNQLRPKDRVSLVVYAGAAGLVLPSTSGKDKNKIIQAIDNLSAGGSTAGGAGIQLAYKIAQENFIQDGNNRVILATDGDFNVGVSSDAELVRMIEEKRENGVFLTVLGYGMGNYKDNKMEQLADKGNGNYAYIDNILEAKKTLVNEFAGTLYTIAKDVKLQIEWNPAKVKGYRLIGYENRMLQNEDFNDDTKDAGELGAGHTVTAIYEIIPAGSNEHVRGVDLLKYQHTSKVPANIADEIMTVKFRYKKPEGEKSTLLEQPLIDNGKQFSEASENLRWAATVSSFGMLLRDSKFKGDASYDEVISWAKEAKGKDDNGYRAEFIKLVEVAKLYDKSISKR